MHTSKFDNNSERTNQLILLIEIIAFYFSMCFVLKEELSYFSAGVTNTIDEIFLKQNTIVWEWMMIISCHSGRCHASVLISTAEEYNCESVAEKERKR